MYVSFTISSLIFRLENKEVVEEWSCNDDQYKENDRQIHGPAAAFLIANNVKLKGRPTLDAAIELAHVDATLMMSHKRSERITVLVLRTERLLASTRPATASVVPLADFICE